MKPIVNLALVASASAFPTYGIEALAKAVDLDAASANAKRQADALLPLVDPPFDADAQYVSNQGEHAFDPPGPDDARGMCPGLNAMANHHWLPHSGKGITITQFVEGTREVFGMSPDLATFLAVFGATLSGDGTSWSLEGEPHTGIGGSHGHYETDNSPLRGDLYQYGSNQELIMSQWEDLASRQPRDDTANFNIPILGQFKKDRYDQSIANNPYFSMNPFAGQFVAPAAFSFRYRFMGNKSAEDPAGRLTHDHLMHFDGLMGEDGEGGGRVGRGWERIPDGFHRRNDADLYSIPYFQTDLLQFQAIDPRTVNTFNQIDVGVLTKGAYKLQQLMDNPACYLSAVTKAQAAKILGSDGGGPIGELLGGLTSLITDNLDTMTNALGLSADECPEFEFDDTAFAACPGFSLYGGPEAEVAPGAIQP